MRPLTPLLMGVPGERSGTWEASARPRDAIWPEAAATEYDRWYESPVNAFIDKLEKQAIREILPVSNRPATLLDVGTGTGHWLPFLAGAGYRVAGLDASAGMLAVARSKFDRAFDLIQGDAHCLPFRDACFDVVCAITLLEFVGDHAAALDEMYRCLKPGGTLVLGVLNALSFLGIKRKILRRRTFQGAHFFTAREVRRCLAKYGAPVVTTCAFLPPYACLLAFGSRIEKIGKALAPSWGHLIVAKVEAARID